jgi:hypothetical protein
MKYVIQYFDTVDKTWERSIFMSRTYNTKAEADAAIAAHIRATSGKAKRRAVPVPYRRHAAITPLELRGAIAMLTSARKHVLDIRVGDGFDAYSILYDARLQCVRALEELERGE